MKAGYIIILVVFLFTPLFAQKNDTIKLGFLIQESDRKSAANGAQMAINRVNEQGGISGKPVQLIIKGMEGPWGTGSKQAVSLIFEDDVWALLGSHDGRNAHLVEQAATKSIVIFVSAWSSDPTLTQTYVPWFFNCMPNDKQQAEALITDIYTVHKYSRVVTLCDDSYESKQALETFLKYLQPKIIKQPRQLQFEGNSRISLLIDRITDANPDCIILFCRPSASYEIVRILKQRQITKPVYGTLTILDENELTQPQLSLFTNQLKVPAGLPSGPAYQAFKQRYIKQFGQAPGMVAAYAYDATNMLIEAIRQAGSRDREKIQKAMYSIRYEGVTGIISFDDHGNRGWSPAVVTVKKF
jgi:branched-chain amino acid transport system substrate-binding protein